MRTLSRTRAHRALLLLTIFAPWSAQAAASYYVSPTGSDSAAGTEADPWASIAHAQSSAAAGDTIYVRGGTYSITAGTNTCSGQTSTVNAIALTKSGTAGNLIKYWAYPGEVPIFDYSELNADCRVKGFAVTGNYIHLKGITVRGVKQRNNQNHESWGVWISGSNNLFEQLDIYHIDGTGLFIQDGSNNLVLNCDSHENFDPLTSNGACESGDGFGAHVSANKPGNVFRGCRAWFNSDDDFDLINAFSPVTIENCWAWHAGYRYDTGAACGNGNGFKCGGYGTDTSKFPASPPVHVIRNNLSVGNRAAGFYANHHPGNVTFHNNTSYGSNPDFNMLGMNTSGGDITVGTYRNNLAVGGKLTSNATNPDDDNNSWTLSVTANTADLQNTSETGLDAPRKADGSLPDLPNFRLASGSDLIDKGVDVGLPFNGAAPDLGCFETGGSAGGTIGIGGSSTTGGTKATGGAGGTKAAGGASPAGAAPGNGGTRASSGTLSNVGGNSGTGEQSAGGLGVPSGGSGGRASGGTSTQSAQSTDIAALGGSSSNGASVGGRNVTVGGANATVGGASGHATSVTSAASNTGESTDNGGGCSCRVPMDRRSPTGIVSLLSFVGLVLARVRRHVRDAHRVARRVEHASSRAAALTAL